MIDPWKLMEGRLPGHRSTIPAAAAMVFANDPLPFFNVSFASGPQADRGGFEPFRVSLSELFGIRNEARGWRADVKNRHCVNLSPYPTAAQYVFATLKPQQTRRLPVRSKIDRFRNATRRVVGPRAEPELCTSADDPAGTRSG